MKKKIIMRGLFGLPTGIAIGFVITRNPPIRCRRTEF